VAYVVVERLNLERWGNRVPQLSFEVTRQVAGGTGLGAQVQAVAMIPGTGEYTLATSPVGIDLGLGETRMVNRTTASAGSDFRASMKTLGIELPRVQSVSLVVSWFGDDLRCNLCTLRPKVESREVDARGMPWRSGGITRAEAMEVPKLNGAPVYGGTPSDASVIEALRAIRVSGRKAMFYPFILMEQLPGNGKTDPWTGAADQPALPWRGRITGSVAPGLLDTPDGTAAATTQINSFFGKAAAGHFSRANGVISYSGPNEWSYRRFILHYAHLCAEAGGVDTFVIGSEMVGLTRLRRGVANYPAVTQLKTLAGDVRAILGPAAKITYAADWSEYFGDPRGVELRYHLDPLWSDENIDAIGIDNYMPLSDWREGEAHADAARGSIYNRDYLKANVAGGELYDWYYADQAHRDAQIRTPITDGAGEPWVWRVKDIRNWWENEHFERLPGTGNRRGVPSAWVPRSKPVWFTEMGCAALDKGTNQPNKFLDALSSESMLPYHSDGRRDDAMQAAYVAAMTGYWSNPANNPVGPWGGRMVDMSRAHVWCWDARPYPSFPARTDLWSDGPAWARGHWLNGRAGACPLADVVADLCRAAGIAADAVDVSGLHAVVRGFVASGGDSARASLQALMLAYGFDAVEGEGRLTFRTRDGRVDASLGSDDLAETRELPRPEVIRAPDAELAGRVRLTHVEAGTDYETVTAEAILPDEAMSLASDSELSLALTRAEGRATADRWLAEARVARDALRLALPPSRAAALSPGDVLRLDLGRGDIGRWRIDRMERAGAVTIEAVRVEPGVYKPLDTSEDPMATRRFVPPIPLWAEYLDLPLLTGEEVPHAPHVAVTATPWPGAAAVWSSAGVEGGYALNRTLAGPSVMGVTLTPLERGRAGVIDRGAPLRVRVKGGSLRSVSEAAMLSGANVMAIGDGTPDQWEVFQFATATLVGPSTWELTGRLRGQAGTDAIMPAVWPTGSTVVLIDGAPAQLDLPPGARGQLRHWRIGPALRGLDDPAVRERVLAFPGAGLRPLSPCHLRQAGRRLGWVRRTRIGGDGWDGIDVPLGEASEAYVVRLVRNGARLAEAIVNSPFWDVPPATWSAAEAGGPFAWEVAQLSEVWGAGPFTRRDIDA